MEVYQPISNLNLRKATLLQLIDNLKAVKIPTSLIVMRNRVNLFRIFK